jgi:hypothetical protein
MKYRVKLRLSSISCGATGHADVYAENQEEAINKAIVDLTSPSGVYSDTSPSSWSVLGVEVIGL